MNRILIRSCERDDYIGRLAYESFKHVQIEGNYIFLLEDGAYRYIPDEAEIIMRDSVDNFIGQLGVKGLIKSFKDIYVKDEDFVYISDSDIVMKEKVDPVKGLSGTGGHNGHNNQVSGQLQIMDGALFNRLKALTLDEIDHIVWKEMIPQGQSICDDSFISYFATKNGFPLTFHKDKWVHEKMYKYEPRTDWKQIIKEIHER